MGLAREVANHGDKEMKTFTTEHTEDTEKRRKG